MQLINNFTPIQAHFLMGGKSFNFSYFRVLLGGLWLKEAVSFYENDKSEKCLKSSENFDKQGITEVESSILNLSKNGISSTDFLKEMLKLYPDFEKKHVITDNALKPYLSTGFFSIFSGKLNKEGKELGKQLKKELVDIGWETEKLIKEDKSSELQSKLKSLAGYVFVLPLVNKELNEKINNFLKQNVTDSISNDSGDNSFLYSSTPYLTLDDTIPSLDFDSGGGSFGGGGSTSDWTDSDSSSDSGSDGGGDGGGD